TLLKIVGVKIYGVSWKREKRIHRLALDIKFWRNQVARAIRGEVKYSDNLHD
uniref:Uncharacterized protein n=1 Tax=Oryza brachyantha TaxID=4533 RepID=J3LG76_ORYBR